MTVQQLCKALSDETRVRIARCLRRSDLCVCELADALDLPQSTLSNHLAKLRSLGLVEARRERTWVYYRLVQAYSKIVEELFDSFDPASPTERRDEERLRKRLAMRVNGRCMRSYGQLQGETS